MTEHVLGFANQTPATVVIERKVAEVLVAAFAYLAFDNPENKTVLMQSILDGRARRGGAHEFANHAVQYANRVHGAEAADIVGRFFNRPEDILRGGQTFAQIADSVALGPAKF